MQVVVATATKLRSPVYVESAGRLVGVIAATGARVGGGDSGHCSATGAGTKGRFVDRERGSRHEGPATSSGHRNPPWNIPDFEKNQLFYLRPDLPHS